MHPASTAFWEQAALAALYYFLLLSIVRLAGKRLAGQTTTFDLIVLISLGVVLQTTALREGTANAAVFVGTVFGLHWGLARLCGKSRRLRRLIRGAPRVVVRNGILLDGALTEEGLSVDELKAGLRKLGFTDPREVALAVLEETGHISAVGRGE